ncbi:MAG: Fic family protein [Endomicrobium sp.]|nr:Fic family protein [Endomicrobium sp.]
MPLKFEPKYAITNDILKKLLEIEAIKERVRFLPLTPKALASLRESSKLFSTHYSTMIEGNRLTQKEVSEVLLQYKQIKGRQRDEKEIKGYYKALHEVSKLVNKKSNITEKNIKTLHGYIMGANKPTPTEYRTEQNVIKELGSGRIVYLPPEAKDVPGLMSVLVSWLNENKNIIPIPILAAIAHYQYATIHPYYDGNGRTARILTTLLLHLNGYDLKGIYNLEEYYAKSLQTYYSAIDIGESHNYYFGRAVADITSWIEYFITGMLESFGKIEEHIEKEKGKVDQSKKLNIFDSRQKQILILFEKNDSITSKDLEKLFKFSPRTARQLAQKLVKSGLLKMADKSKKNRSYKLINK